MFSEMMMMEKKDACYYKVKASAKVWPSAYASGRLVQCRKKGAANYGNKSEGVMEAGLDEAHHGSLLNPKKGQFASVIFQSEWDTNPQIDYYDNLDDAKFETENASAYHGSVYAWNGARWVRKTSATERYGSSGGYGSYGSWEENKQGVAEGDEQKTIWRGGLTISGPGSDIQAKKLDLTGDLDEQGIAEDLSEEFDLIESIIEGIAEHNGVDAETVWADLESLTEDELYAFAVTSQLNEDWQKANKRDRTAGMSQKAVNAYRRENPGSKLKTAVTTKPSKLKKGSKASKRRKSYCSRSRGQMKMHNISCAKTPDKAICKARRRWNC
jgi:hypothetical protein